MLPFYGFGQLCSDEDTVLLQRATTVGYSTATLTGTAGGSAGVSWAVKYVRSGHTDTITTAFSASITKNLTGLYSGVQYKFRYLTFCGSTTQGNLGYGSFNTTSTEVQYTPMIAPGYQFKYLKADSGIAMPIRDTSTGRGTTRPGPVVINSADSMPYFWNGVYWKPFALDSAGLQAQINLKVDSVTVSGDSLFYWVNGTGYGQVITGLNAATLQEVFDTESGTAVMDKDNTIDASLYNFTINSDSLKASGAVRLTGYGTGGHTGTPAYYLLVDANGRVIEDNPTITIPLSSLTAASASNTINNANNKQTWQWNSLSATGLLLSTTSTAAAASAQTILEITSSGANSNATQSTYGIRSTNTHTGTASSNYGGYFSASGASLNNIGAYGIATGSNGYGVYGNTNTGKGVYGNATGGYAFYGVSSGSSGSVTAAYFESSGVTTTNIALRLKAANSVNKIALAVENGEGSVGIGTLTPAAVFHTVGTVRMASMGSASTDTTTYKPMGISSLGDVIPLDSWPQIRWKPRVGSTTSSATPTINTDNVDIYKLTAQAADITSFTTNLSGTPRDGDILEIQITGTAARAITWGSSFVSSTVTLPTTTSGTATLTVILQYYTTSSYGNNKWVCVNYY